MNLSLRASFVGAAFALLVGQAQAQATPDQLIVGHWECTAHGVQDQYERITNDYTPGNAMEIKLYSVQQGGAVRLSLTLSGNWAYDPATGVVSESISAARIGDMIVNGRPMARSEHPAGEAGLSQLESQFVAQYGNAPFAVTSLTQTTLVLTDGAGDGLNCTR